MKHSDSGGGSGAVGAVSAQLALPHRLAQHSALPSSQPCVAQMSESSDTENHGCSEEAAESGWNCSGSMQSAPSSQHGAVAAPTSEALRRRRLDLRDRMAPNARPTKECDRKSWLFAGKRELRSPAV